MRMMRMMMKRQVNCSVQPFLLITAESRTDLTDDNLIMGTDRWRSPTLTDQKDPDCPFNNH